MILQARRFRVSRQGKQWLRRVMSQDALSRRELLKAATVTASFISTSEFVFGRQKNRKVIVVGAGFAGLACAHELVAAGCDVTILEARDRLGGRVCSMNDLVAGKTSEAGGEMLGSNHPTALAYCRKFGLNLLEVPDHQDLGPLPLFLDGKIVPAAEMLALEPDLKRLLELITDEARSIDPERPWNSPNAERLDFLATSARISQVNVAPLAKRILGLELAKDNAVALSEQSYLGNLAQIRGGGLERYWTDTEIYRCEGGNQQIAFKLAEAIGAQRIVLDCPVTRIDVGERRVVVRDARSRTHEVDQAVLAVPPSVWSKITITPPLSPDLKPQLGKTVKQLAVVNSRFWLNDGRRPETTGDGWINDTWCSTDGQADHLPGDALTAFTSGEMAQLISDTQPNERRSMSYAEALEQRLPGYPGAVQKVRYIDWLKDPWTLGSYSFPSPGQVTNLGPLLESPHHQRLHFSGEHTCYQFVGYMEGALHSGVATAKRLVAQPVD